MHSLAIPYGEQEVHFQVAESHPLYVLKPLLSSPTLLLSPEAGEKEGFPAPLPEAGGKEVFPAPLPEARGKEVFPPPFPSGKGGPGRVRSGQFSELRRALDEPIGMLRLAQAARASRGVVILADDLTRPTPVRQILPLLLDQLNAGGV
ncbi:MAG: DUF2088 domain-containing protein, partial [Planctomycetes bacterium]|nr:DUF2088 domain-containing protein [Planctomycetota bacterium]